MSCIRDAIPGVVLHFRLLHRDQRLSNDHEIRRRLYQWLTIQHFVEGLKMTTGNTPTNIEAYSDHITDLRDTFIEISILFGRISLRSL